MRPTAALLALTFACRGSSEPTPPHTADTDPVATPEPCLPAGEPDACTGGYPGTYLRGSFAGTWPEQGFCQIAETLEAFCEEFLLLPECPTRLSPDLLGGSWSEHPFRHPGHRFTHRGRRFIEHTWILAPTSLVNGENRRGGDKISLYFDDRDVLVAALWNRNANLGGGPRVCCGGVGMARSRIWGDISLIECAEDAP